MKSKIPDKNKLIEEYQKYSQIEIAERRGVSRGAVYNWLKKYGIKTIERRGGKNKTNFIDEPTLHKLYVVDELSTLDIGEKYGVGKHLVRARLKEFGIKIRSASEARMTKHRERKWCGKNNPSYKKGYFKVSGYYVKYLLPSEKEKHRADKTNKAYLHTYNFENYLGRKLTPDEVVHHVDLDRSNNEIENLILFPNQDGHMKFHKSIEQHGLYCLGVLGKKPRLEFPEGTVIPDNSLFITPRKV